MDFSAALHLQQRAERNSHLLKKLAYAEGFAFVGISKARFLAEEAERLSWWLQEGLHGSMMYMENHFDKRLDPTKLVPGCKSVVSLLYNYHQPEHLQAQQRADDAPKISQYAYGKDYHHVVKDKLRSLWAAIEAEIGHIEGRIFVDSAPVMERTWAKLSGLGWVGKHSLLINKSRGSYFFLAEILVDVDLKPDDALVKNYCGTCTRCIDACPTQAILPNSTIDANRCISHLTIELKANVPIPQTFAGKMDNWMFGCDVCQQVCPWNRFAQAHQEPLFTPHPELLKLSKKDWENLTKDLFNEIFRKSAVKRAKYSGLMRNIAFLKNT